MPQIFTKNSLIFLFILLSTSFSYGASIKGHVFDAVTKEQLVGAFVTVQATNKTVLTELDGSFNLRDLEVGAYELHISYLGYDFLDSSISIADGKQSRKVDFYLTPSAKVMKEVVVKSTANGGSDAYANRAEQRSISIMNIVSANAIQISPDIAVANVMQRVSGVTIDKGNSGEAQYAVIRGMDKRYNSTLVNGVKIPSPNDRDRYVPLDIFPAELLERLEVVKTLMPSMEADATGGVVNMVMKNAPDKLLVEGSVAGGYSSIFKGDRDFLKFDHSAVSKKSPAENLATGVSAQPSDFPYQNFLTTHLKTPVNSTASLTLGNRFLNKKLGVLVSGSFQNMFRGTNSEILQQNATVAPSAGKNDPLTQTFSDVLVRQYSTQMERMGAEAKVDYNFNDNNTLSFFATYLQLNEFRVRSTIDSLLGGYSIHHYIGSFAISDEIQTRQSLQGISNFTLQGKHKIVKRLNADWSVVASKATRQLPDIATFSNTRPVSPNIAAGTMTIGAPLVDDQSREWMHNSDKDYSAYANLRYLSNLIPGLTKIDFGGMYRHKARDNYDNKYKLKPVSDSGMGFEAYKSIEQSKFFFTTNAGLGTSSENPGVYTFTEDILAYYVQLHEELTDRIKLDGGVRLESTTQSYVSSLPVSIAGKTGDFAYTDFLPSLQGKYELNKKSAIRVSYFKSIYRPAYADLIPFLDNNAANEIYPTIGNPNIRHTIVDNFDLRYELFPKGLDQVLVNAFYKSIKDPIEYALVQSGYSKDLALTPGNFGNANNYGVEFVFRKFFGSFGLSFNYTYTKSVISSAKRLYYIDANNKTQYDTVYPSRPLQGQADHIGNLSLLYKNTKLKIDAQLAGVYTGERILTLSAYEGLDNWVKPAVSVDFSAQKQFGKHFTAYFKANNLFNTGLKLFIKQPNHAYTGDTRLPYQDAENYITVQHDTYFSTFLLGLRFKF